MRKLPAALVAVVLLSVTACAPNREAAFDNCVHDFLTRAVAIQPETVENHPELTMEHAQDSCQKRLDQSADDFYQEFG